MANAFKSAIAEETQVYADTVNQAAEIDKASSQGAEEGLATGDQC